MLTETTKKNVHSSILKTLLVSGNEQGLLNWVSFKPYYEQLDYTKARRAVRLEAIHRVNVWDRIGKPNSTIYPMRRDKSKRENIRHVYKYLLTIRSAYHDFKPSWRHITWYDWYTRVKPNVLRDRNLLCCTTTIDNMFCYQLPKQKQTRRGRLETKSECVQEGPTSYPHHRNGNPNLKKTNDVLFISLDESSVDDECVGYRNFEETDSSAFA